MFGWFKRLLSWWCRMEMACSVRTTRKVTADDCPGPWTVEADPADLAGFRKALEARNKRIEEWIRRSNGEG